MLRSMTGFAHAQGEEGPWILRVRIKTLNHRYLDLRLRVPDELEPWEGQLRARVRDTIQRGHADVSFHLESGPQQGLGVNESFVERYLELYRQLQERYQLSGEPDLTAVLRFPGALRSGPPALDTEEAERLGALAHRLLEEALGRLDEMRRMEGATLERELRSCLEQIRTGHKAILGVSERILPAFHRRLKERLQELLDGSKIDPERLAEEAAYLAGRSDVREELTRLASHTDQFIHLLDADGVVGKRLDFLLQEMNRETTTLLSKAPSEAEGLEMTRLGLDIKAQIERLREQVQNVE